MSFLKEKAGEGPEMAVLLAVKLQHELSLHAESKSNPPMNVCAGISVGYQLSPLGYSHILSGPEDSPLLAPGAAAPLAPTGLGSPLPCCHGRAAFVLDL